MHFNCKNYETIVVCHILMLLRINLSFHFSVVLISLFYAIFPLSSTLYLQLFPFPAHLSLTVSRKMCDSDILFQNLIGFQIWPARRFPGKDT